MSILENFLTYVKIDTQSDENVSVNPTTKKQFDLGNLLVKQLHELGVKNAFIDDTCYVYGFIPCNTESTKTIGLIAHMDTATELTGKNVKPQVIEDYDGKDIVLNKELNIILSPTEFRRAKYSIFPNRASGNRYGEADCRDCVILCFFYLPN